MLTLGILGTALLWIFLWYTIVRYWRDAHRAFDLEAQIATIKDACEIERKVLTNRHRAETDRLVKQIEKHQLEFDERDQRYRREVSEVQAQLEEERGQAKENFKRFSDESRTHQETKGALRDMTTYRDQALKEKTSPVLISVCVTSLSAEPSTIARGKTLVIKYQVDSSRDLSDKMWLGAAFWGQDGKPIFNRKQDEYVSLAKGVREYRRYFGAFEK